MTRESDIHALLKNTGARSDVIDTVMRVDAVMQNWRRRMNKRELGHKAIAALGLSIDMAQLDTLLAIAALENEFREAGEQENTVGMVADRLHIDPSRASRLVSEMVGLGYVLRNASQADSRRTVLELTDMGWALVHAVLSYKWLLMSDHFSTWPTEELEKFVPLLEKFSDWVSNSHESETRHATEIEALAHSVQFPGSGRKVG